MPLRDYMKLNEDKINHASCGYVIGFSANCAMYEISKNKTIGFFSGLAVGILAGHLKETYDKNNGCLYNKKDLRATIYGAFLGSLTIRLTLWNSIHRKKATMEQIFESEY